MATDRQPPQRRPLSRPAVGERGEAIAAEHLLTSGWRIVERNWRCRRGEIDIIAMDGEWLVFVEVRSGTTLRFGRPEESVGLRKRRRLVDLGELYLQSVSWDGPWRIDVVAVSMAASGLPLRVVHYQNAVWRT